MKSVKLYKLDNLSQLVEISSAQTSLNDLTGKKNSFIKFNWLDIQTSAHSITALIIYMEKLLSSDWLR